MNLIRFLWQYARRYTGWLLVAALSVPLYAVASTALVALIEPVFSEVLRAGERATVELPSARAGEEGSDRDRDGQGRPGFPAKLNIKRLSEQAYARLKLALGINDRNVVWFVPALFLAVYLLRATGELVSSYSFRHVGLGVIYGIRNDLYRRFLDQSSAFHSAHPSGELVSRVVSDVGLIQNAINTRLFDLLTQPLTLVLLLVLLFSTNWKLALIVVLFAPLALLTMLRFGGGLRRATDRAQARGAEVTALLGEGILGHRVVKAFGMEQFEAERFGAATRKLLRVSRWGQLIASMSSPVIESLAALGSAALLVYVGLKIREGELTAPVLVQFLANVLLLYEPIRKLNRVNLYLQYALAGANRVRTIMQLPVDIADRPGVVEIRDARGSLRFENVHFSYGDQSVLRGIDLEIRPGEIVALVGPSGAGKTSLVNLLPRFFDVTAGRVLLDDRDIRDITLRSLREQIGLVTQETVLFNDSIRNNIAYGRSDLPLDRVREAARAAYADDFIMDQPQGYETIVGESGSRLSGGQRQRLSIARATLKGAPILILDEATSHLDSESEALVQKALQNLMHGRTTLVVAHRLTTVMRADRIVVLEAGRIVETGTHAELVEVGGLYRKLYDLQFQEPDGLVPARNERG